MIRRYRSSLDHADLIPDLEREDFGKRNMPGKRARRHFSQLSEFERGLIIEMKATRREDRRIVRQALVDPTVTRRTIRADVGVAIVPKTISRHLAEANLKSKRPFRTLPLTPEHRQLRLPWCQARSMWNATDWQKVVFSDEPRNFPKWSPRAIFEQDNARPHTARVAQDFLRHFQILPRPARSPNLSPVEHVWDQLKRQMPSCHSVHDLELVVQDLWAHLPQDNIRRPVPGRPRATAPAEDRFLALSARRRRTTTVPQLVADHFQASGRRISATTVRNRLHNAGLYARRPVVCVPLNGRQRRNRLCWAREHVSWTQQQLASVLFTDESRFTMESDSGRLLIWREQRTRYHQSNTVERHSYRGGGILVWAGISLGGHTDLHVFHGGTVTGLRYRDEILDPYVRPYAAAIGNDFILMDDNARPHRARIVEEYLEDHGLERMKWPARSPDLNPIEHLWDYLGREVAALNPPPRSLHELKQSLLCVWSSLPIPVSDNLINSMGNRCRQCIQVRGGHIPY
ncbi:transposable element Tcb2 transposase [Trichonephila clavipes]|nr:transposable element Tcb2 transposase [Trichonephila clavipes]